MIVPSAWLRFVRFSAYDYEKVRRAAEKGRARRVEADERREAQLARIRMDAADEDQSYASYQARRVAGTDEGGSFNDRPTASGSGSSGDDLPSSLAARRAAHADSVEFVRSALRGREVLVRDPDDPDAQLREALLLSLVHAAIAAKMRPPTPSPKVTPVVGGGKVSRFS